MSVKGKQVVGLLGGSFNPPHHGHIYISHAAIERLKLDGVWWLPSPHNPMKDKEGLAAIDQRVAWCKSITNDEALIEISTAEIDLKNRYSYELLGHLTAHYPEIQFIWLMGEDNWHIFNQWYRWQDIAQLLPIAVLHRDVGVSWKDSGASKFFEASYIGDADQLKHSSLPAWTYLDIEPQAISSTHIRRNMDH